MDVLFGSIDVRDLLSTTNCDESSPLSAPDLRLLIDRLQIRSLHIKDRVRDYVLSHHQDFADIFSRFSQAASKSETLFSDLFCALQLLSDNPVDLEIRNQVAEIRSKVRELEERREALELVRIISILLESLQTVEGHLKAGRLVQASEAVRDLKAALLITEGEVNEHNEPVVFSLLRKKWTLCFDELQGMLAKIVENAIQFEPENGRVRVSSWLSIGEVVRIELERVLEAMDMIGVLDYGLAKVADLIIKHVMNPIISNGYIPVFVEDLSLDSEKEAAAILSIVPSSDFQECLDVPPLYPRLVQVMEFIHKFICFQKDNWMLCFGRLTWSRISDLVITCFLSKAIPDDASEIAKFQNILNYTVQFETSLKEMMFIPATDSREEKLSLFVHNVEVHFASRKKNEILAKARNLILQGNFVSSSENMLKGNSSESTVDLLFQSERCFVSKAASQLMELVHQTLKDVCLSSRRVAMEFYHAARDALLLYKAIVAVKLEKQLDSINQAAIIIYNDFLYLSQEIAGLAFEYRADFPHGIKELAVFVDIAPDFRQMAEDILQKQVQLVRFSLKEATDGADGFQNTHQMQQFESAKFSMDQVIFILEKVHITWERLLPKSVYKRTMCLLLDHVFSSISKDILLLDDMAAEETLQLQRLINLILDNLASLFESLVTNANGKEKISRNDMWILLDEMIPSFRKFRKLADLLDMPLKSITTAWESGELIDCGFTSAEVENFVKAIFTDTPLRKESLWRIGNEDSL